THTPRQAKRGQDTKIPQSSGPPKKVGDEAICIREDDIVVRAATTATSLEAEQESGNINKTRSTTTLNEPSPQGTGLGSGPSMEHQDDLMDFVPPTPYDSPLSRGHTPRSGEGRPNVHELMVIYTQLSNRILALEQSKTAQDLVIKKLQKKVKRLVKKQRARTLRMNLFKTRLKFKEGDIDDNFDDINDMVDKSMENVERETVNAGGAVNTATTR
nr:hypothetical protein [Tanacetum cinerariifolium]